MTEESERRPSHSAWPLAVVLAVLMLLYVLSYAPVVRLMGGWKTYATVDGFGNPATVKAPIYGDDLPVYKPLDWLIDETPLRDPLLWWADVWGVRGTFVEAMMWRPRPPSP